MNKTEKISELNEHWLAFFKHKRLEWVTSDFPNLLIEFFENIRFIDATIDCEENGYAGESYHTYIIDAIIQSKVSNQPINLRISTVDRDMNSDESWAVEGWIEMDDTYEGRGHIGGGSISKKIGIEHTYDSDIDEVFSEFELRRRLEEFLYSLLNEREELAANEMQKKYFNEPMVVKSIKNYRGYYTIEFENGVIVRQAIISYDEKN